MNPKVQDFQRDMLNNGMIQLSLKQQMNEAKDKQTYYKLRNDIILTRIQGQEIANAFAGKYKFSAFNHDTVKALYIALRVIKGNAEDRTKFACFNDPQVQTKIDEDYKQTNELLNKIQAEAKKNIEFSEQHSVKAENENARYYAVNDQTKCHNPVCTKTQFTTTLYKCSRCQNVLYCGTTCQRADRKVHRINCIAPEKGS